MSVQNGESRLMGELQSLHLLHLGHPLAVSLLLILLVLVAQPRHLLSVIELGGLYYYDSSDLIVNKTFQVISAVLQRKVWGKGHALPHDNCRVSCLQLHGLSCSYLEGADLQTVTHHNVKSS